MQQRTICLRRLDYLDECVDDVDSLLLIGCVGARTKDRLRKWRGECRQRLAETLTNLRSEQDASSSLLTRIEQFKASNQLYGTSDALKMQISPSAGRGLYAARPVDEDELLLIQEPYASVLSPTLLADYCSHCFSKLSKLGPSSVCVFFPCRQCIQVRYCSAQCERNAWVEGHEIECAYLDLLNYSQEFHLQPRLAMRVLLKGGFLQQLLGEQETNQTASSDCKKREQTNNPSLIKDKKNGDSKKQKKRNRKQQFISDSKVVAGDQAEHLQPSEKGLSTENELHVIQRNEKLSLNSKTDYTKKRNRLKKSGNNSSLAEEDPLEFEWADVGPFSQCDYGAICSLRTHADECPDFAPPVCLLLLFLAERCGQTLNKKQMQQLGCQLLQHLQQVHCNSKYILGRRLKSELFPSLNSSNLAMLRSPTSSNNELMTLQEHRLGLGLYSTYCLLNHDCQPNALSFFEMGGNRLHLKALRSLKPGQQIVISYGVSAMWQSRSQRIDFLKRFYFFTCDCGDCMRNQDAWCSAFRCAQCSGPIVVDIDLIMSKTPTAVSGRKCCRCGWTMKASKLIVTAQFVSNCEQQLNSLRSSLATQDKNVAAAARNELEQLQQQSLQLLHEHHQLHWRLQQLQSVACQQLGKHEQALQQAEQAFSNIEKFWSRSAYSAHFNARLVLLDRQLALLRQTPANDRLRMNFLQTLKALKKWMDSNLAPNTDEYMYLLSFLSLCFSSYSGLMSGSNNNGDLSAADEHP